MLIVRSQDTNVFRNLAMEEWLFDHAPPGPVLFLYVNDPCVVIGKNQNPWRECRLSLMEQEGVALARRISGGGAVYHDAGNLNVSVMVARSGYRESLQYELIFRALDAAALPCSKLSMLGRSSLAVDGKKFSGHAFCHRRDRTLHHGTLLVSADLPRLGRYLGPDLNGIETNAVASIPAAVANLCSLSPELNIEKLSGALCREFRKMYGRSPAVDPTPVVEKEEACAQRRLLIKKISSSEWTLGGTPKFVFNGFSVEKGRVINAEGNPPFDAWLKINRSGEPASPRFL